MIFITGPLYAGKSEYIRTTLGLSQEELESVSVRDVQALAADCRSTEELMRLAEELSRKEIVIATEVGGGLIPLERDQREKRERAGRLACLLAERADTVIRVCCGLPQLIKGQWPS